MLGEQILLIMKSSGWNIGHQPAVAAAISNIDTIVKIHKDESL